MPLLSLSIINSYLYLFFIFICFCLPLLLILYMYLLSFLMIDCWFFLYLLIVLLNIVYISNPHGTLWLQCAASIVASFIADGGGCNMLPLDPFFMSGSIPSGDWGPFQQEVLQCGECGPLAENMFLKNHNSFYMLLYFLIYYIYQNTYKK